MSDADMSDADMSDAATSEAAAGVADTRGATEPIVAHARPDATVAYVAGEPVAAERFVGDVQALAARLGNGAYALNVCEDRYAFAVAFCAALVAGRVNLLPAHRTAVALAALAERYPGSVLVHDLESPRELAPEGVRDIGVAAAGAARPAWPAPRIARDATAAIVFTSGSTGEPMPQSKPFGPLVDGARAEAEALGMTRAGWSILATVPPQHMYGLESSVLLALHGPHAFSAARPLHAAEVAAAAAGLPAPRALVTTPVHLRVLDASDQALPRFEAMVSATAPLDAALAARCEQRFATRVLEVYGCSETGMVATRRTVEGAAWQPMRGIAVEERPEGFVARGGHVARAGVLADRMELLPGGRFTLLGRHGDVVNVAGKRTSLGALNHALLSIDGVADGVYVELDRDGEPGSPASARGTRLAAIVVSATLDRANLLAALRRRVDPVFLPRPVWFVPSLPRNALGKIPHATLAALVRQLRGRPDALPRA